MVWSGWVWCGLFWHGWAWVGVVWHGVAWCGMVWRGVAWYGMVWPALAWSGMVWHGVAWCGMVWHGMAWCGMVWHGMAWWGSHAQVPHAKAYSQCCGNTDRCRNKEGHSLAEQARSNQGKHIKNASCDINLARLQIRDLGYFGFLLFSRVEVLDQF